MTKPTTKSTEEPSLDMQAETGLAPRLSGVLGAGAALATGELFSGIFETVPSLVVSVGEFLVDTTPGAIARFSIDLFGSYQKTILVWGIAIASLLLGGVLGRLIDKRRQHGISAMAAVAVPAFGLFAVVGALAASRVPTASAALSWLSALTAAAIGAAATIALLRRQATSSSATTADALLVPQTADRRRFLNAAALTGLGGIAAAWGGSWLRRRFAVDAAREEAAGRVAASVESVQVTEPVADATAEATAVPTGQPATKDWAAVERFDATVAGITPLIVPNSDFYRIDTALTVPQINPATWSMKVTGMVDTEIELTFDDLLERASVEQPVTLSCVSNEVGGNLVGNALWLGVPLRELLEEAGVQAGADQIVGRSVDGWTGGFPLAHLDDPSHTALVAVGMNGEPLPVSHGFPARLVIAGLYGYVSATKWLSEIELTTLDSFDGYWIPRGWSKLGPVKTQSRIDVPLARNRRTLSAGPQAIAGVAWAPTRSIEKVEVRIDDGPWQEAVLPEEMTANTWRQWRLDWNATPGDYIITVRATDGDGVTQPERRTRSAPNGADGWHQIRVQVA